MKNLTFITGNPNKVKHVTKWIGLPLQHHKLDLDEIQSLDLHTVAEHKVRQAYDILKQPVLIEDAALTFLGMGRLPGTYIKWFIEEMGVDGVARLAQSLDTQEAVGDVCYAIYDGHDLQFFDGQMRGSIVSAPKGEGGFGFDKIFMNEGFDITRAEMNEEDYASSSYRMDGLRKLKEYLG